jgi:hypothetical protein
MTSIMASSCRVAVLARLPKIFPAAIATNTRKMTIFQGPSASIASQGRGRGRHSTVARVRLLSMDAAAAAASHSNPNTITNISPNTGESSSALVKLHTHNADDKDVQVATLRLTRSCLKSQSECRAGHDSARSILARRRSQVLRSRGPSRRTRL